MRRLFFSVFLSLIFYSATAHWSVKSFSDTLPKRVDVVIKRYATDIEVFEDNRVLVAENLALAILDNNALQNFVFYGIISDSIVENSLESKVFDENGKKIKQAKVKVFQNHRDGKKQGLFLKVLCSIELTLPLSLEFEYKQVVENVNKIHAWNPTMNFGGTLQNSSLRLTVIDTSMFDVISKRIPLISKVVNEDGKTVFLWELNNSPAIKKGNSLELPLNDLPTLSIIRKQK